MVPAPLTGIGWVAVQRWDEKAGEYRHMVTLRSQGEAEEFIGYEECRREIR